MNSRQRILSLFNGQPAPGLAWNALVDIYTLSAMPAEIQAETVVDFCRRVDCEAFQLGDFSLPEAWMVGDPYQTILPGIEILEHTEPDDTLVRQTHTPWGDLRATFRNNHPIRYPVNDRKEIQILKKIWQATKYVEAGDDWLARYRKMEAHIGGSGVYTHFLWPSPVQRLIEYEMGLENFYYLLKDHPVEVEDLMEVMQARWVESLDLLCRKTPAEIIISAENTSTTLISPAIYHQYSLPHLAEFVRVVHSHQKKAVLHMCGWIKHLLGDIRETDLDGVHALTPPTIGDTPFDEAMKVFGNGVTLMGLLDGVVFHNPEATTRDIQGLLDRMYTPRLRQANFILVVAADGLPTPFWKFEAVQEWMTKNGER
jgi:hypothetical protein